jgi:hypothetical protein
MELGGSLPHSQEPAICPCPEAAQSLLATHPVKIQSNPFITTSAFATPRL